MGMQTCIFVGNCGTLLSMMVNGTKPLLIGSYGISFNKGEERGIGATTPKA